MDILKKHFISAGENFSRLYDRVNAPYLRKSFTLPAFSTAELYICGLGFYELYINGQKHTKGKLAPYISNPDHYAYYDKYDVSAWLKSGGNAIGVILGNGFLNNMGGHPWGFEKASFRSAPKLSLLLLIDGKEYLFSDKSFKTAPSPIFFDDLRCGEYYDARLEQPDWSTYGFDDSAWTFAQQTAPPKGEMRLCTAEPVRVIKELSPVTVFPSDGGFIFDFGVNAAGICRFSLKGSKGQKIILRHCETLTENHGFYNKNTCTPDFDRELSQKDIFICSGKQETFEPSFTYHGFRYVFLEGVPSCEPPKLTLDMLVLSSDLPQTGIFRCSDETVNRLQEATLNSDRSNFFYFPTDCPQREKNGWTGDAVLSAEQMLYNLDCANSFSVWLDNIRAAQKENGRLPAVVPTFEFGYDWGSGPAWDMVLVELPYQIYRFTGEIKVLQENSGAIAKYLRYLKSKVMKNGLIAFGLTDWCECGQTREDICSTPLEISDTLISIDLCQKSAFIFRVLSDSENERYANEFALSLKSSFRKNHLTPDLFVSCRSQTAQAQAIAFGVFRENEVAAAAQNLVTLIKEKSDRFHVGVLGARVLFRVLAQHSHGDLALQLMTKDGFPSYKYWLDHGATSLWEGFNELRENSIFRIDGGRVLSLNHHFWGDISAWFYRYILGININPNGDDCNLFEISPLEFKNIEYAEGSYIRNGNGVSVSWKRSPDGKRALTVKTFGKARYFLTET
ncbi:MAG: family 78 glycoside hydrolase catalytic domain [Clostridia bacterium]|nr:family 78 glycoside hydrolase catalytic domain [Clostridia bacterium]